MTDPLKAMVEAMVAELQAQASDAGSWADQDMVTPLPRALQLRGTFDIEKAARAGLAAIQAEPRDDLALDLFPGLSRKRWRGAIDAILKETP